MNPSMRPFARLLQDAIGLDAASVGPGAVERAVRARMQACVAADLDAYWQCVRHPGPEQQLLIESVVVPESWFFRDRQAFVALAAEAHEQRARHPRERLRVLSIPCAGGEEPYSIAMALLDAGIAPAHFQVDAVDVSEHALALAQAGCYGRNAFRGDDLGFRERHFVRESGGFRISQRVRACVAFRRGNLFDPALFEDIAGDYAMVFCRNLLIYFDRPTQERALAILRPRLARDGTIFVAPSEAGLMLHAGFRSLQVPLAFGFRCAGVEPARAATPAAVRAVGVHPLRAATRPSATARTAPADESPRADNSAQEARARDEALSAARALADAGQLDAAAQACAVLLQQQAANADALSLLGLVHDAAGRREDAATCYRKALYLDPQHNEALVHLAYLLERRGETAAAARLRARGQRQSMPETGP